MAFNFLQLTCETIVAHAAPAIPYPRKVHKTMSPTPFIALATANAFKGPHESFIPRLRYKLKKKRMLDHNNSEIQYY